MKIPRERDAIPLSEISSRLTAYLRDDDDNGVAVAVDIILSQAVLHRSSDIHLEPWQNGLSLRYRVDGMLHQIALIPQEYQPRVIARIKVLADLVVYRRDLPQDGRIDISKCAAGRPMRVSTVPTIRGEKTVIRILGETDAPYQLDALGFPERIVEGIRSLISRAQGAVLLTGPSSSGKTTTIYAALQEMLRLQQNAINIVTLEDPVEYCMDRISQIQVNPHADFTFSTALRSILRQDPEVIMVGEIRDLDTARMAIQAGLTGHLVISTIHSGTAAGVFTRLLDMGIEPFLIASAVSGVLAQRLARLNCAACALPTPPDPLLLRFFNAEEHIHACMRGAGCPACSNLGYQGRTGLAELLLVDSDISELLLGRPTTARLHDAALDKGMIPLSRDGLDKAAQGKTTLEELLRVLPNLI